VVPYGDFATQATHDVTEETLLPLPTSTSRLKIVDLAFFFDIKNR
jgi:hypothetical protein